MEPMVAFSSEARNPVGVDRAILQSIAKARRRLRGQRACHVTAWMLAVVLCSLALANVIHLLISGLGFVEGGDLLAGMALAAACGVATFFLSWRNPQATARRLDAEAGTKDRFFSTLALSNHPQFPAIEREAAAYAQKHTPETALRFHFPRAAALWGVLGGVLLVISSLITLQKQNTLAPELAEARQTLSRAASIIRQQNDPRLTETARKLEELLQKLPQSTQPRRDAWRALADVEQQVSSGTNGPRASLTPEEIEALADAMVANDPAAAGTLAGEPGAETARSIEALDPAALAQALREAAEHTKSTRLREMTQGSAVEMRARIAAAYRTTDSAGNASSQRESLLQELRDIKADSRRDNGENSSSKGQNMTATPPGTGKPDAGWADNAPPGAAPGTEKDRGTGQELQSGDAASPLEDKNGERLASLPGSGPSTLRILQRPSDDSARAGRERGNATTAAQSATLDAVIPENIPPGSRLLVRRYFEAIRPQE